MSLNPRLFPIIAGDSACAALLGSNPCRFFPGQLSEVNKKPTLPYAVQGISSALPQNYLGDIADMDQIGTQIDIFAATYASAEAVFDAMRAALQALENKIMIGNYSTPERDPETNLYHVRMEIDVWQNR